MKQLPISVLILCGLCVSAYSAEKNLADYKALYAKESAKIESAYQEELNGALTSYGKSLNTVKEHFRKAGDLTGILALKKEQERFQKERSVSVEPPPNLPLLIQRAQSSYRQSVSNAKVEKFKRLTTLTDNYLKRLAAMKKALVFEEKLDEAIAAASEMKRVEFIIAEIESTAPKVVPQPRPSSDLPTRSYLAPKAGQRMALDLGDGVKMEFVWVAALDMWVGKYEVTNEQYRRIEPGHNSKHYKGHSLNADRQPVVYVSFGDAKEFAKKVTHQLSAGGNLPDGYSFRLPTENEWMAFAQCGDGREYPWGDNWPPRSGQAGNYSGASSPRTGKISGYRDGHAVTCDVEDSWANPWGLYGVGGNVWECCAKDNLGGSFGAWRGASWDHYGQDYLRCSNRLDGRGSGRSYGYGFRLVLSR